MTRVVAALTLTLALAFVTWAQPTRIMQTQWTSGSDEASFNWAREQTSGPVVYDLTGNGTQEVIVTGRRDVWVFNMQHPDMNNCQFHWHISDGYEACSPATIAHVSSDGLPWVVVGASKNVAHHQSAGGCPEASTPDAANSHPWGECCHWHSVINAWKVTGPGLGDTVRSSSDDRADERLTTPAAADVDGDG